MAIITTSRIIEKVWGPDDRYFIVEEFQVLFKDGFRAGQKVRVTVEIIPERNCETCRNNEICSKNIVVDSSGCPEYLPKLEAVRKNGKAICPYCGKDLKGYAGEENGRPVFICTCGKLYWGWNGR